MPANYVLLERIELNASAASVTFSNIPQSGYTDLKVVHSIRQSRSDITSTTQIKFNGSSSNLSCRYIQSYGSGVVSGSSGSYIFNDSPANSSTANTFGNGEIYIPNYTGSTNKSVSWDAVTENNATAANAYLVAGLWSNTAAITSIELSSLSSDNFMQYSTFSLYGLAAVGTTPVIAPKASGGNIQTDGTYWYHTFLSTGAFVPQTGLTCDYLVVAGGGGGSSGANGGGGGGGYLTFTSQSLSTSQTITVGSGGAGGVIAGGFGFNGNDSQLGSLTLVKGGGGGGFNDGVAGLAGGSGGGGGYHLGAGGAATSGQGYAGGAGGAGNAGSNVQGGGGGGAGAVGSAGTTSPNKGGAGGTGAYTAISGGATTGAGQLSGGNYYFAGGGGGATWNATGGDAGLGGGAAGTGTSSTPSAATINTGGGGGGSGYSGGSNAVGGAGGSGIVIIRYPIA